MHRTNFNSLHVRLVLIVSFSGCFIPLAVPAQQSCPTGVRVEGQVTDSTGAAIPGAQIRTSNSLQTTTDATGHFFLPCVLPGPTALTVEADGFTSATENVGRQSSGFAHLQVRLAIASLTTSVQVNADPSALDTEAGASTTTLSTAEVRQLPDDPDDLLQQLQLLASTTGGAATSATVVVDGFQNGSAMPPKSSIASIRVNPDPIAPEYEKPGVDGGRIEITTKPGSNSYHGALFFTDSDPSFNATDPFSTATTPANRRRYGFELNGPIVTKRSGFALALEKRDIDEFNVVNATTPDANGDQIAEHEAVPAPQRLWIASARADLQATDKDLAALTYAAHVNNLGNQGVGGLTLAEAGYSSLAAEYDLRFSNSYTLSANILHETRVGYTWKRTQEMPNSTSPALQVAGYFVGGGTTSQDLNDRERDLEIDDDLMVTRGKHTMKFGAQSLGVFTHDYDPDTFNGAYIFGGGSAPVLDANNNPTDATTTISPIEQYRRSLLRLAGGNPTTYQVTQGNPLVPYTVWRLALYGEDTVQVRPRLNFTAGLRYAFQTTPSTFANFGPRLGVAWAPDKNSHWALHLRAGIFNVPIDPTDPMQPNAAQPYRLNGVRQQQATVYSPSFSDPLTPITGSIKVGTEWQFPHGSEQIPVAEFAGGIEHDLPYHWHPNVWYTWYEAWGDPRSVNVNAPMVANSSGAAPDPTAALLAPRPGPANLNIFQYQNSAHNRGGVFWAGIDRRGDTRWTFSIGYWNVHLRNDGDTPQSSYTNLGESARPDWESSGALIENDIKLPFRFELSAQVYWHYGTPYNITTGTDANGDGTFNDRPSYATLSGDGVYSTPFGLMTANIVNGNVPRNLGTMPVVVHTYGNLSRIIGLNGSKEHPRTLTLNVRAANWLNHTNVTAVNTVLSSAAVGQPVAAEAARRVELGARFAF